MGVTARRQFVSVVRGVVSRAAGRLIARTKLPPRLTGFRIIPTTTLDREVSSGRAVLIDRVAPDVTLPPPTSSRTLSPPNGRGKWGRPLAGVNQGRRIAGTSMVTLSDARVLIAPGQWEIPQYSVVTSNDSRVAGVSRWVGGHRRLLRSESPSTELEDAVWLLTAWPQNYFHWLIQTVPRLLAIRDLGFEEHLVLPESFELQGFHRESAQYVGIALDDATRIATPVLRSKRLTVVHNPDDHPSLLGRMATTMRERAPGEFGEPSRRVYVSRRSASYRRVVNDDEIESLARSRGFEIVSFENLSFGEQVTLMSGCRLLLGPHGAGLANLVFMSAGGTVIEFLDSQRPNRLYFELASVMGLRHLSIGAKTTGTADSGFEDLEVDVDDVATAIDTALRSTDA